MRCLSLTLAVLLLVASSAPALGQTPGPATPAAGVGADLVGVEPLPLSGERQAEFEASITTLMTKAGVPGGAGHRASSSLSLTSRLVTRPAASWVPIDKLHLGILGGGSIQQWRWGSVQMPVEERKQQVAGHPPHPVRLDGRPA